MPRLYLIPLLIASCMGQGFAQAPDSVSGYSYRDITTSIAPYTYYNSLEFHADGTYATRALIYGSTVRGDGSYYPLVNGMFTYLKQGLNNASITLSPTGGAAETLILTFTDNLQGSVTRGPSSIQSSGSFYLSPPSTNVSTSLVNVSTLVSVHQGASVTIGFVVTGTQVREFLVRVVGPSLAQFGVGSPAPNPVYSLFGQSSSFPAMPGETRPPPYTTLGGGWSFSPDQAATISAEITRAGAFPLTIGSSDKSDVFLLSPGAYTVAVSPSSNSSEGTVLIEVYEIH